MLKKILATLVIAAATVGATASPASVVPQGDVVQQCGGCH